MNRTAVIGAVALLVAAAGLPWLFEALREPAPPASAPAEADPTALPEPLPPSPAAAATPSEGGALDAADQAFAERVRAKFGPHMKDRHSQIKAIEQVVAYLMQRYPDDWRWRVKALLAALFPELADELFAQFEKLTGLNEWLAANRAALMKMSPEERRAALWNARREAFGDAAEEIWAGERRNEQLADAMQAIERAEGRTTDEKLQMFVGAVQQAYGDQAQAVLETRGTELMNRFLAADSIQKDLAAMPRAEQHATLRRVRSAIGLDEDALQRWDELDRQRDAAWDRGQSYMLQRDAVLAQFQGAEQQQRLSELQQQVFGPEEAATIAAEEASGFFRYARPRRIGRE